MPEYSSTTITPADGVKTPAMNGSTSGNYTLSALRDFILASKGQANGLASLDANGKLPSSQLPDLADDVIVVASYASLPATGTAGKIYITADNNKMYRWDPDLETPNYVELSIDLSEYARIVDIQDGNIQAGVAVKAFQDAMGRAIITTYATKADLQDGTLVVKEAEIASKDEDGNNIKATYETKADASDLKDAISFNRKRIENLEQKSGSVVDVDYPEYSVTGEVPTGKAKNAIVSKLRGVSVAWNQLAPSLKTGYSRFNLSETSNPNSTLFTLTGVGLGELYTSINFTAGHKVLVLFNVLAKSSNTISFRVRRPFISGFNSSSGLIGNIGIVSDSTDKNTLALQCDNASEGDTFELDDAIISYDLTQMFGPSVADYLYSIEQATTGAGVALFRALVSAQDNSHETGRLVSTTYESVWSIGKNLIDETSLVRKDRDGASSNNWIIFNTPIKYEVGQTYYFKCNNFNLNVYNINFAYFDSNGDIIAIHAEHYFNPSNGFTITASYVPNASYMTLGFYHSSSLASYSPTEVICCLNSVVDKTYTPYLSPDTLPLPSAVTLRGIFKVVNNNLVVDGDEYNPETGEIERRYALVNLGALDESYFKKATTDGFIYFYVQTLPAPVKRPVNSGTVVPRLCSSNVYDVSMDANSAWSAREIVKSINIPNWTDLQILDTDATTPAEMKANLSGVYLFYEVATPTSESVDPVLDPTLATEGGGALSTEQTQDPAIVSALEMTYLTL